MTFKVLDLFSGIGGFSLGLERTGGFETVAFCEINPFCRQVLAKHWPEVPCYDDVRTLTADKLNADGIAVDVICGGFPCQDISVAGKRLGLAGRRSGLWREITRLVGDVRPSILIVENVAALLNNGMGVVLGDLASLGYDAEWHCIPASAIGAPHQRDRFWCVAWDADSSPQSKIGSVCGRPEAKSSGSRALSNANSKRQLQSERCIANEWRWPCDSGWWGTQPGVGRVAYGVPRGVDRLRALGNAVVPQIPELIGNAILASLAQSEAA